MCFCGITDGEEGYGTPVWYPRCDIGENSNEAENIRAGIKLNQNKLHQRMLQFSEKKCHPASVGDDVIIPIERPDRMTSLGQRNLFGEVTEVESDNYTGCPIIIALLKSSPPSSVR